MAVQILKIPASAKKLSDELIRLVDLFNSNQVSEEEFTEAVQTWKSNVPQFLLADNGSGAFLNDKLIKYIGKRRAIVVSTVLAKIS